MSTWLDSFAILSTTLWNCILFHRILKDYHFFMAAFEIIFVLSNVGWEWLYNCFWHSNKYGNLLFWQNILYDWFHISVSTAFLRRFHTRMYLLNKSWTFSHSIIFFQWRMLVYPTFNPTISRKVLAVTSVQLCIRRKRCIFFFAPTIGLLYTLNQVLATCLVFFFSLSLFLCLYNIRKWQKNLLLSFIYFKYSFLHHLHRVVRL